jgi:hypothetical protein
MSTPTPPPPGTQSCTAPSSGAPHASCCQFVERWPGVPIARGAKLWCASCNLLSLGEQSARSAVARGAKLWCAACRVLSAGKASARSAVVRGAKLCCACSSCSLVFAATCTGADVARLRHEPLMPCGAARLAQRTALCDAYCTPLCHGRVEMRALRGCNKTAPAREGVLQGPARRRQACTRAPTPGQQRYRA